MAELGKDLNVNRIDFVVTSLNQRFMSEIIKLVTPTDEIRLFTKLNPVTTSLPDDNGSLVQNFNFIKVLHIVRSEGFNKFQRYCKIRVVRKME